MKLKSVKISGLHNNPPLNLKFHDDLNILTGKNGAGKTTILKLIWYIISGHIDLALNEIDFSSIEIETDIYVCNVEKAIRKNSNDYKVEWEWKNKKGNKEKFSNSYENTSLFPFPEEDEDSNFHILGESVDIPIRYLKKSGSSVFLPTFRRIEGGFLTESKQQFFRRTLLLNSTTSSLEEALINLSEKLTTFNHTFVASVSTVDIESLLIRKYSELSEKYNRIQQKVTSETMARIKNSKGGGTDNLHTLELIQRDIEEMEKQRQEIMKPLDTIKESVLKFFKNQKGIRLGRRLKALNFGDTADAINSNLLSAGEKQMLSFLAYNTFHKKTIFIIDEPELSLHVDWQRILLPTLMKQDTSNQFIIATHSPFIYSKYPEKEIQLTSDRGYCENQIEE